MFSVGLQGSSDLVYVIPPCQWPENVDRSVAAKLTRPMPGIIYDPLPPRSDCTMKKQLGVGFGGEFQQPDTLGRLQCR